MRTEKDNASQKQTTNSAAAGQARAKSASSQMTGGGYLEATKMSNGTNRNCSCGRPATLKMFGDAVCQRCAAIDSKLDSYHDRTGRRSEVAQVAFKPTPSPYFFPASVGNHYRKAVLC